MRARSSMALSLRRGSRQRRIVCRMLGRRCALTAGVKLMKNFPMRFFDRRGRNVYPRKSNAPGDTRAPVVILAVDDASSCPDGVPADTARAASDALQDLLRLRLRPAVRDDIIGVPLEGHAGMYPAHPVVEREVQKNIRHQRTQPLRPAGSPSSAAPAFRPPVGRELRATAEIEENPRALRVLPHGSKHQFVVEIIEESLDVQINHPVIAPAPLPRTVRPHPARTCRVDTRRNPGWKCGSTQRLQIHLRPPSEQSDRHRGNAQAPRRPPSSFGIVTGRTGGGK